MAASWIKVEVITPDKPEVFQLSEIMNLDPDAVLGKLVRLWAWADQQTIDGNAKCNAASVTKNAVDRITFVSGFADALISVGWLAFNGETLIFPNFERHNGNSSKKRALTNDRVTKSRQMKRSSNAKGNAKSNAHSVTPADPNALPEVEEEVDIKDQTPHNAHSREGEILPDDRPFPMFQNWRPVITQWPEVPPDIFAAALADFVVFWQAERSELQQSQWEQKFERSLAQFLQKNTSKQSRGSNANVQTTDPLQQVRAARNAERARCGLEPLGDNGEDLFPTVAPEERHHTLDGLGPNDFKALE
ncbi:DnaT-like ssDNA-binding domain-containing protein [Serratia fonticola]|uniref:DnaT-like ssDNA-binding domain-containing protein n=1 Tax=Serratia fonticola TaxID=47917 RepID=UPI0027EAF8B9|nr:DnaT-like ssDNA-binding domain-containing protein [Serratia fonticola]MDQ7207684.1 DnaT-like ssDNA-binding domain-containing protein [Serratia fonticola]